MDHQDHDNLPHRRFNLLTGEWILVSPHRTQRPWSGQQEAPDEAEMPVYDRDCYLCPGNRRAAGQKNPDYTETFVFTNDFSALLNEAPPRHDHPDQLLRKETELGLCKVICYSPRHDLTISRMKKDEVRPIIDAWVTEYRELGMLDEINHVQIFENRGQMMGCSNAHPHGQIWANSTVPTLPALETEKQFDFYHAHGSCLLCTYLEREIRARERIISSNNSFIALVPFWAVWPFETMIIPRRHAASISSLNFEEKEDLAGIMIELGVRYDNLFKTSFPFSMGIHQKPTDGSEHHEWHWHVHYFPPLLRSRSIKKHMVGYELLAMPQRDLTAETAAEQLRNQDLMHYLDEVDR